MSVGRMRHYVRVRIPSVSDDGEGGQATTWTDGPAFWANVLPMAAHEQGQAGAVQAIATHRVFMHYDTRVTSDRRLAREIPSGPELQIIGVRDVDGRQRWMEVDCAEVV